MSDMIAFLSSVLFFVENVSLVGTLELKIEGVFHEDWSSKPGENISTRTCHTHCYDVCVSFHFSVTKTADFFEKLQSISSENHDVIIIGGPKIGDGHSLTKRLAVLIPPFSNNNLAGFNSTNTNNTTKGGEKKPSSNRLGPELKKFISRFLGANRQITLIVFHDDTTALYVGDLLDHLSDTGVEVEVMHTKRVLLTRFDQVITLIHERFYRVGIYCLLFGTPDTILSILTKVNSFDGQSNRTTNFRHLSHWLVLTNVDRPDMFLPAVDRLENVALVDIHTYKRPALKIREVLRYLQSTINLYFDLASLKLICLTPDAMRGNLTFHIQKNLSQQQKQLTVFALHGVGNASRFDTVFLDGNLDGQRIQDEIFPNKKYKLNGVHLLVSTKPWPGYVEKVTRGNQTTFEGMCIEMLKSMANALNFTYTLEEVPDGEWGVIVNGSWTGIIRQLQERAIDIGLADLSIHSSRDAVMDYIYPSFKSEVIDVLFRLHNDSDINLERLTTPLKPMVLPIMAGSLCAVNFLYLIVEYTDELAKLRHQPWYIGIVFWRSLWHLIGSILSQGGSESPRSCSGRLLMASWWLFCIIFSAMYSATLTVSFCVQRTVVPFTTIQEMVHDSDYKWGMFNGSINTLIFKTSKNPLYIQTYKRMMEFAKADPNVLNKDMEAQLDKVVNDKYAFISSRNSLNVMIQRAPKGVVLTTLGERVNPSGAALGVPTGSPLLPEFEWVMTNLKESGVLQYWLGQFWNRSQPRPDAFQLGGDPLPLTKLLNAFCMVAFGVSVSITALICESILKCIRSKTKEKSKSIELQKGE